MSPRASRQGVIVEGSCYAGLLAGMHRRAFGKQAGWDIAAMAVLLDMRGCFACLCPPHGLSLQRVVADEAELLSIAVLPMARGRGVGTALLRGALGECARRGANRLFLEAATGNLAALALYRSAGFIPVGRRTGYYPDGSDALVLAITLCGSTPA